MEFEENGGQRFAFAHPTWLLLLLSALFCFLIISCSQAPELVKEPQLLHFRRLKINKL